jgi:hypothetical protein
MGEMEVRAMPTDCVRVTIECVSLDESGGVSVSVPVDQRERVGISVSVLVTRQEFQDASPIMLGAVLRDVDEDATDPEARALLWNRASHMAAYIGETTGTALSAGQVIQIDGRPIDA